MATLNQVDRQEIAPSRDIVRIGGRDLGRWPVYHMLFLLLSSVVIANALIIYGTLNFMVTTEQAVVAGTPITRFAPLDPDSPRYDPALLDPAAVVIIAHGFSGSQQIMWPFASTLARNGYAALTLDFPGHGANGTPFTADSTQRQQALSTAIADARQHWPGKPLVLLGHSMGSAAVVQYAGDHPDEIAATIAVSLVAEPQPGIRNLLVLTGALEGQAIKQTSLDAISARLGSPAQSGFDYGSFADGSASRMLLVPSVEHALVIWSSTSLREAVQWVDRLTNTARSTAIYTDVRMIALAVLVAGVVWFWWSLTYFTFRRRPTQTPGANLGWPRILLIASGAGILTPILLRWLPTNLIPVQLGSYVALHFGLYGLLVGATLFALGVSPWQGLRQWSWLRTLGTMQLLAATVIIGLGIAAQTWWINLWPPLSRVPWAIVIFGLLAIFFIADAQLVSSSKPRRTAAAWLVTKLILMASLGLAIALDHNLFFILLILPILAVTFALFGLMGACITRRTGNPFPAALATAALTAWIIAVSFPFVG